MPNKPIVETTTTTKEVTGVIADLIGFARHCSQSYTSKHINDDTFMLEKAREYWDRNHGE